MLNLDVWSWIHVCCRTWELTGPWTGARIQVPVKFIVGDSDLTYHFKGAKEYIHEGGFKRDVPLLEEVVIVENAGHFVHEEKPHEINTHIHDFIKKFWTLFPLLNVVTFFWVLELFILSSVLNFSFIYLFVINFRSYFSISRK